MNRVKLLNQVPPKTASHIVYDFFHTIDKKSNLLPLQNEENNLTNHRYFSSRSKGLSYVYSESVHSEHFIDVITKRLEDFTGLKFDGTLQKFALPIFHYDNGSHMKPHRDIDKLDNNITFQSYVAVVMLTKRGRDFKGGRFYLNAKATSSADGKEITNDLEEDRYYPNLDQRRYYYIR